MDNYIQISKLNDFVFCPFSLYFHSIYEEFSQSVYHRSWQTRGKIVHQCFDKANYSTAKKYLQGLEVYSEKYRLCGKIDLFDKESGVLTERKNKISRIYDGYLYQLYAQYFCLSEMGYSVNCLALYSLSDNKKYEVDLPDNQAIMTFESLISEIRSFDVKNFKQPAEAKCENCIYRQLCFS